mmetsp:Transcript_15059/g.47305  ORF Transcript_15059/g.47305 Transcript_15059/m.47305 type:complete len:223 (+) Transcript_15059:107-775(+)
MAVRRGPEPARRVAAPERAPEPPRRGCDGATPLGEAASHGLPPLLRHLAARAQLHAAAGRARAAAALGAGAARPLLPPPRECGGPPVVERHGAGRPHSPDAVGAERCPPLGMLRRLLDVPLHSRRVVSQALCDLQHAGDVRALVPLHGRGHVRPRGSLRAASMGLLVGEVCGNFGLLLRALDNALGPRVVAQRGDQHILQRGVPHHRNQQLRRDQVDRVQAL